MKTKTHMLATDLDHTFVGRVHEQQQLLQLFEQSPHEIALVYVTGRHAESAKQLMTEEHLPIPDLLISDVGTKIWHMPDWHEDGEWKKRTLNNWQPARIKAAAALFPLLHPQSLPDDRRVSFKAENASETVQDFEQLLVQQGIAHRLVYSSSRDLDILPAAAGKGSALDYVVRHLAADGVQLLVAGDSGNDIDMLTRGWPSVIVGNAQDELKAIPDSANLFRADRECAGGIYDAWCHFYGSPSASERVLPHEKLS